LLISSGTMVSKVDRMRNCRGRNRRLAANIDAGVATGMTQLDRGLGASGVDGIDEAPQTRNEAVVIDSDFATAMPPRFFRRGHLHGDQAGAAAHPRHVVGDAVIGNEAVVVRRARGHRRHDDAVFNLDRSDACGGEKDVHPFAVPGNRRLLKGGAVPDSVPPQKLFDHLIGVNKELLGDLESRRLSSFQIDHEIVFGRQLYRQIAGLLAA
jgi:hypothetical protein